MSLPLASLALARCAELATGEATVYDAAIVGEEARLAAREVADRLPWTTLLTPAGMGLVKVATATTLDELPYREVDDDDTDEPHWLRGRAVMALPADASRVLSVRLNDWTAPITDIRPADGHLWQRPPERYYGTAHPADAALDRPVGFLIPYAFHPDYIPATDPVDPVPDEAVEVRLALALAPAPGYASAALAVAELYYTEVEPDPDKLTGALRDATAWLTASRLLAQDPETAGMSADATARAEMILERIPARGSSITYRRGAPLG